MAVPTLRRPRHDPRRGGYAPESRSRFAPIANGSNIEQAALSRAITGWEGMIDGRYQAWPPDKAEVHAMRRSSRLCPNDQINLTIKYLQQRQ